MGMGVKSMNDKANQCYRDDRGDLHMTKDYDLSKLKEALASASITVGTPAAPAVDNVNHPLHYQLGDGLEVWDVIQASVDGMDGHEASAQTNIIKYALRWKHKNGVEDLKKCKWYLNKLITYEEGKQ